MLEIAGCGRIWKMTLWKRPEPLGRALLHESNQHFVTLVTLQRNTFIYAVSLD